MLSHGVDPNQEGFRRLITSNLFKKTIIEGLPEILCPISTDKIELQCVTLTRVRGRASPADRM